MLWMLTSAMASAGESACVAIQGAEGGVVVLRVGPCAEVQGSVVEEEGPVDQEVPVEVAPEPVSVDDTVARVEVPSPEAMIEVLPKPEDGPSARSEVAGIPGPSSWTDAGGSEVGPGSCCAHPARAVHSVVLSAGMAGDGFDSGVALAGLAWRVRPTRGPGRVEVGLEGLRSQRWIQGVDPDEPWAQEPALGYWLWTRAEGAGSGLAPLGGLGFGVDNDGLSAAVALGIRSGDPSQDYVELLYVRHGGLGGRLSLEGLARASPWLRAGVRTRVGDLPHHDGDFRQARADGAAVVALELGPSTALHLAGGVGGYDLLWDDAGPTADFCLERSW